jgi:hypothetical protein
VPTSILAAHVARLPKERRAPFASAVGLPLDYVRLTVSAVRGQTCGTAAAFTDPRSRYPLNVGFWTPHVRQDASRGRIAN